jgi:hypothetical protein
MRRRFMRMLKDFSIDQIQIKTGSLHIGDLNVLIDYLYFLNYILLCIAGWSSLVARWAHNPKVGGSNPPPATK